MAAKSGTSAVIAASPASACPISMARMNSWPPIELPRRPADGRRNRRQAPKTKFKGLIDLYLKSSEWPAYKPMTRKTRGHIYEKWAALDNDTEDITRSVIIEALEARKETPSKPTRF